MSYNHAASEVPERIDENGGVKSRAILLGLILAILFSAVNGYLSINLGMSFSYGAVDLLLAYLIPNAGRGILQEGALICANSSASTMGIYQSFALVIYMLQTEGDVSFPSWMGPPKEAVLAGSLDLSYWITPITMIVATTAMTVIVGVIFTYLLREEFIRSERMIWPTNAANASLVDACMIGGGSAKLVGVAALIGFTATLLQNLPSFWGYDLTMKNLSRTPFSMMGLGMGMILPPHYIVPFGLGGIIRWYTDRRYGREFYVEKGRLIVTGLTASSLIVQVIMTVLTNFV